MQSNTVVSTQDYLAQMAAEMDEAGLHYGHGTENSWDEACWLFETIMRRHGVDELAPDLVLDPVSPPLREIQQLTRERIESRKPMAYLLREAWFCGHCFYVDERVLVPRSPIAELIRNRFEPMLAEPPRRILDLCAGSGCIGLACARAFPGSEVVLADVSAEALDVARINIDRLGLADRVSCVRSDLFESLDGEFDLIVSNPPYVGAEEYAELPAEYLREPSLGLLSERQGLDIPLRILREAPDYLAAHGALVLETGATWPLLDEACGQLPLLWIEFEYGGEGVCWISREELLAAQS